MQQRFYPNKPKPEQNFYHENTKFLKHEKEHFFLFRDFVLSRFRDCF